MADQVTLKNQIDIMAMAILVVLSASWGLQQVAIKIAYQGVPPILQAGIRSVGATILLWIWMSAQRQPIFERDGTLWWGIAAGLLFTAEFIMIYWGLEFTSASRAAIFINTAPFIVALGAQFFIPGEQLRLVQIVGLCSAFAGIVVAFSESAT
ncbi:MAG: DMT family transporter, partial [Desulfobacterales bacterium]